MVRLPRTRRSASSSPEVAEESKTQEPATQEQESTARFVAGLALRFTIGLAVVALVTHLVARPFVVPSASMEGTLRPGDRIVATVLGTDPENLPAGAVVAFGHGQRWEDDRLPRDPSPVKEVARTAGDVLGVGPSHRIHTVKRVIGTPGTTVGCCSADGRVMVDGTPIDEPYLGSDFPFTKGTQDCTTATRSARCFGPIRVPEGSYLVLGDNRVNSSDSVTACRGADQAADCARFVHAERVVGKVDLRVWPLPPGTVD